MPSIMDGMNLLKSRTAKAAKVVSQTAASVIAKAQGNWTMQAEILTGQKADVDARIVEVEAARASASLDAASDGDERLLSSIHKDLAALRQKSSDLHAAIGEANRRQAADEAAARALSEAERKAKLAAAYDRYATAAARIDQSISDMADLGTELNDAIAEVQVLTNDYSLFLRATTVVGAIPALMAHRARHLGFKHPVPLTWAHNDPKANLAAHLVSRRELGIGE